MSDEKFSSCPPSFPIAITTKLVGAPLSARGGPELAGQRGVAESDRHLEADVRERRQLARHLLGGPPAELARAEAQDLGAPHQPQPALEIGEVARPRRRRPDLLRR